jgi:hypothetical protein
LHNCTKNQLIVYAKDDIEILLKEREEIIKLINLFDVIETNFDKEETK